MGPFSTPLGGLSPLDCLPSVWQPSRLEAGHRWGWACPPLGEAPVTCHPVWPGERPSSRAGQEGRGAVMRNKAISNDQPRVSCGGGRLEPRDLMAPILKCLGFCEGSCGPGESGQPPSCAQPGPDSLTPAAPPPECGESWLLIKPGDGVFVFCDGHTTSWGLWSNTSVSSAPEARVLVGWFLQRLGRVCSVPRLTFLCLWTHCSTDFTWLPSPL